MSAGPAAYPAGAADISPRRRRLSSVAVILAAAVFGITYGLSAPLIALELARNGANEAIIGLNAAMHALGVLIVAPLLPRWAARFPAHRLMVAATIGSAAALAAFPLAPALWMWFVLRLLLGMAAEVIFVVSETWTNTLADDHVRGRMMAVYTASLSLGFALGPALLSVAGPGAGTYWIGAALCLATAVPMLLPRLVRPTPTAPSEASPLRYLRLAPIAIGATLLNAGVETAGLSFIVLYANGMGWSEQSSLHLVTTLMVGAIVLQLPIGWLADRVDRRRLVFWLAAISAVGALAWPAALAVPWVAYAMVFVWGGLFVGIYTVMLSLVGSRFAGGELVGIYAAMGLAWGVGALAGPSLVGLSMHLSGSYGLPVTISLACAVFALFLVLRREGL